MREKLLFVLAREAGHSLPVPRKLTSEVNSMGKEIV